MKETILEKLSNLGYHFHPSRAVLWRTYETVGTVKGLPSFGTCDSIATDGVHLIVRPKVNPSLTLEVSFSNWEETKPSNKPEPKTPAKKAIDRDAVLLTRLYKDIGLC